MRCESSRRPARGIRHRNLRSRPSMASRTMGLPILLLPARLISLYGSCHFPSPQITLRAARFCMMHYELGRPYPQLIRCCISRLWFTQRVHPTYPQFLPNARTSQDCGFRIFRLVSLRLDNHSRDCVVIFLERLDSLHFSEAGRCRLNVHGFDGFDERARRWILRTHVIFSLENPRRQEALCCDALMFANYLIDLGKSAISI